MGMSPHYVTGQSFQPRCDNAEEPPLFRQICEVIIVATQQVKLEVPQNPWQQTATDRALVHNLHQCCGSLALVGLSSGSLDFHFSTRLANSLSKDYISCLGSALQSLQLWNSKPFSHNNTFLTFFSSPSSLTMPEKLSCPPVKSMYIKGFLAQRFPARRIHIAATRLENMPPLKRLSRLSVDHRRIQVPNHKAGNNSSSMKRNPATATLGNMQQISIKVRQGDRPDQVTKYKSQ